MNRALNIFTWVILLGGVFALVGFTKKQQNTQPLSNLSVSIDKPVTSRFVTEENIKNLFTNQGYKTDNQLVKKVNLKELEKLLLNNSTIETAQVYRGIDGKLFIDVKERTPIVRIYNSQKVSFYLDQYGSVMPLSNQYAARVLLANGQIDIPISTVTQLEHLERKQNKLFRKNNTSAIENIALMERLHLTENELPGAKQLNNLFRLAKTINNDKFWKAQISQVFVNENNEIELIPRIGNHTIVFGSTENMDEKLDKLLIFYKKGLNNTGWNNYSTINLKYKNQVVCTKR